MSIPCLDEGKERKTTKKCENEQRYLRISERERKKAEYRETEKPNLTGKKDERYGRP